MKIKDIVKLTNTYLAGEQLTYQKLMPYLDAVIDDINSKLSATFPPFSTIAFTPEMAANIEYDAFPDRYVRSVIPVGAAYKYYLIDEEGVDNSQDLGYRYETNLFYMLRDYVEQVPPYYQSDTKGSVRLPEWVEPVMMTEIMDCPPVKLW